MTPLGWTLIGVCVFVVLGGAAALKLGDWLNRRQKRRAQRAAIEAEPEDVW